jgi:hypothetical protein
MGIEYREANRWMGKQTLIVPQIQEVLWRIVAQIVQEIQARDTGYQLQAVTGYQQER